jgi:hypothetical protein
MMKLRETVIAVSLAFPLLACAQSTTELQTEINALKAQVKELQDLIKGRIAAAPAPAAEPTVELEDFNRIKTKVEAMEDVQASNGMKGLRISGGIDPVYIYNQNKNAGAFSFGNNTTTPAATSYDDSMFGVAYLDLQKEIEGGIKFHLTLMPTKSAGGAYSATTNGSIIQEASASIPLTDNNTRLLVGQIPDVSGYEPWYPTYVGENNISSNLLYPAYATNMVTHNLLWDFTGAYFYTGVGLDMVRGPWETKLFLANVNKSRGDAAASLTGTGQSNQDVGFIFNAAYAQEEFWGFEFTGYSIPNMPTPRGGTGGVSSFEIDGNYTRGTFNSNLQFVVGTQQNGAYSLDTNGNLQDSRWYGMSLLLSDRVTSRWTLATRMDYLYNQDNGGGIFTLNSLNTGGLNVGDAVNGFGPDAADPTGQTGTNRAAFSLSATYHLTQNASLRAEFRRDFATTAAFYDYNSGNMSSTNNVVALQALVNF